LHNFGGAKLSMQTVTGFAYLCKKKIFTDEETKNPPLNPNLGIKIANL
jgi:hypothetical protein